MWVLRLCQVYYITRKGVCNSGFSWLVLLGRMFCGFGALMEILLASISYHKGTGQQYSVLVRFSLFLSVLVRSFVVVREEISSSMIWLGYRMRTQANRS